MATQIDNSTKYTQISRASSHEQISKKVEPQQEHNHTRKMLSASEAVADAFDTTSLSFVAASERLTAVGRLNKQQEKVRKHAPDEFFRRNYIGNARATSKQHLVPGDEIVQFHGKVRNCVVDGPVEGFQVEHFDCQS